MQEILLMGGGGEKPQDENKVMLISTQVLYATPDYDPVQFISLQVLYAVQEEVI